ncbi:hypothetical protein Pmar_PMAR020999 [Perkinsus marinus ATCC 50983]|uniref:Uncharacterized protein n=1 Tax=Perkinsus marinus (strain ATCC 50983 / TXsc) TaxID=423536 RepID=C5KG47_PERM5|nr:hypothetical protein Pmar_PMAR020999 [Perkinsus marinus ATCC 50983]EER16403.1 hypothetical protein Pmar_PMAR020999 [Perkinsus marinus ATCC 50983]|eukprot:XP_002784607.1 hypothetical protein Pmar_PMAR020999 [Perkinsus marinus ATCC 50983]
MIIALFSAFACIAAITDAGELGNEGETPAFHHLRSLDGGGVLCPGSKGKQEFGYIPVGVINKYFYAVMEAEDVDPASAPTFWFMAALFVAMLGEGILRNPQLKIDLKGVMMYSGIVGPYAMLDIMKTGLTKCEAAVDKCNSNGPGKPAKPVLCQEAVNICEKITMDPMDREGKSIYDVRARKDGDSKFYAFKPGEAAGFLNKPNVKQALGVSKTWERENDQVLQLFNKYAAYNGTCFVTQLLDHGLKVRMI